MTDQFREVLSRCICHMLRPIVRFSLRHSIGFRELTELLKVATVDVAAENLKAQGEKVNASRLCVATGLHRGEINRIWSGEVKEQNPAYSARVIGRWLADPQFLTKSRKPRVLSLDGDNSEFVQLVRTECTNVHPGTVLFDLERTGAVQRIAGGVKLVYRAYVPKGDPEEGFKMFSEDATHLLHSMEETILGGVKPPNLHIRTEYDNIAKDDLPAIRQWFYREGNLFHKKVRDFLSKFDLDLHPKKGKSGGNKVFIASFSRIIGIEGTPANEE